MVISWLPGVIIRSYNSYLSLMMMRISVKNNNNRKTRSCPYKTVAKNSEPVLDYNKLPGCFLQGGRIGDTTRSIMVHIRPLGHSRIPARPVSAAWSLSRRWSRRPLCMYYSTWIGFELFQCSNFWLFFVQSRVIRCNN